ncbi:hypothetical protein DBV15_00846 [Temnothorax longispinosus]|uniref:Uncharacterized protein n=1 Tax=Temnothorax longispinosus TaxID=300112 RepID=A0A4S2KLF2_9HYME|nr:hypothetical protein DBV15_00846 [Temnothorax longispinosus]
MRVHDAANGPAAALGVTFKHREPETHGERSRLVLFRAVLYCAFASSRRKMLPSKTMGMSSSLSSLSSRVRRSEERGGYYAIGSRRCSHAPDVTVRTERGDDSGRVPVDKRSDRYR